MTDVACPAGCGRRVRLDGVRCAQCVREGRTPAPARPVPVEPAGPSSRRWRCSCGVVGVELHPLHALFAFYAHRRRCELLSVVAVPG